MPNPMMAPVGALLLSLFVACSDDGARITSETSETSDTTSETDDTTTPPPDTETALSLCDPEHDPVTPVGIDDMTYANVTATSCMGDPCLCSDAAAARVEKLLACDQVGVGWYEGLGSVYMRVAGREDGDCLIDIAVETEGGIGINRCRLPLPIAPWVGLRGVVTDGRTEPLAGIEDLCERVDSCCILDGCPDPCDADVPHCPWGGVETCEP